MKENSLPRGASGQAGATGIRLANSRHQTRQLPRDSRHGALGTRGNREEVPLTSTVNTWTTWYPSEGCCGCA